jgi:nucleotide-binding universal stress UspA family protein
MTDEPVEDDRAPADGESGAEGSGSDLDSEPVAVEEVLVPVDGSEESMVAVEYAVAIAERYDARVHALYVLDEELVRGLRAGTVEEREVAARGEEFMDAARERAPESVSLTHSTAYGFSPARKARHPGSVIVDAAEAAAVDFIIVPREPGGATQNETLSRAAEYVLQYADQPVLST